MTSQELIAELKSSEEFFERSSRCLTEEDSDFRPAEGMYTTAHQVSHVARTIDWFVEGASRPEGFDMDFERHVKEALAVTSLTEARAWLRKSYQAAQDYFGSKSQQELQRALPEGPVMGGQPTVNLIGAMVEHAAHHRGALTVYSRLRNKVPLMPYFE